MTITARLDLQRVFEVATAAPEVFAVLSDVPLSVSHFPKVERLTRVDAEDARGRPGAVYEWRMERVGTEKIKIQTVYACRYESTFDPIAGRGTVTWTPMPGVGNALIGGHWAIDARAAGPGTRLTLVTRGQLDVPLPALMSRVVSPIVTGEFERLVGRYVENLRARFGG